jgi:hypothetical protein
MLCKQDQLCDLEKQLEEIDKSESRPLFLGSLRRDTNLDRKRILAEIDAALCGYGKYQKCGCGRDLA